MHRSIKLVGVGGQGTILAAKVLSSALITAGHDVKMSEIHGMSQRGGSVSTEIRYGTKIHSPVIEKGHADILVAFEQMEAARAIDYLKKDGILLVNDHKINSMVTLSGKTPYPEGILEGLKDTIATTVVPASAIATTLGNAKVMNIVMLGALARVLDDKRLDFEQAIRDNVKPRFVELNLVAFREGLGQGDNTPS
jgi:indolepyruvate ferredoxin oxidoreductase beta subunit